MVAFNIIAGIALIVLSLITLAEYLKDVWRARMVSKIRGIKYTAAMQTHALVIWFLMIAYAILNFIF